MSSAGTSATLAQGLVTNAPSGAFANNTTQFQALGRSGEQLSATVAGTAAQTQAMTQTISWAEWPV